MEVNIINKLLTIIFTIYIYIYIAHSLCGEFVAWEYFLSYFPEK